MNKNQLIKILILKQIINANLAKFIDFETTLTNLLSIGNNQLDTLNSIDTMNSISISRNYNQEEKLICDIINNRNSSNEHITITIPLNTRNILSLCILFILILFGSYSLWNILTRHKCSCKICKNEYILDEKMGEGGFGEVITYT